MIVRFTPNEHLTIDTTGTATKEDLGMRDGVPSGVLGDFSANDLFGGPPYNGKAIPDGVGFYPNNNTRVNFNRPQDDGTRFNYVSNRIKYDAGSFTVTNVAGYLYSNEFEGGDIDGSSLDFFYENESIKRTSLSEEFRLQSVPGHAVDWTGGLYYGHDNGHINQYTYAGAAGGALFGLPERLPAHFLFGRSSDYSDAIFGEVVWHMRSSSFVDGRRPLHA